VLPCGDARAVEACKEYCDRYHYVRRRLQAGALSVTAGCPLIALLPGTPLMVVAIDLRLERQHKTCAIGKQNVLVVNPQIGLLMAGNAGVLELIGCRVNNPAPLTMKTSWRRERDSNPRYGFLYSSF